MPRSCMPLRGKKLFVFRGDLAEAGYTGEVTSHCERTDTFGDPHRCHHAVLPLDLECFSPTLLIFSHRSSQQD